MAVIGVFLILVFPGSAEQDTDYHYMGARTAWVVHAYFVDVWGRPLFTALFAPVSRLGYTAARFFALAISLAVAWQSYRLATDFKMPRAWLVIPFLLGQPVFFELYTDLFTETVFALVFVVALRCHLCGRVKLGMVLASLLPLARPEGVFLCICWGVWISIQPETESKTLPTLGRAIKRMASTLLLAVGIVGWWLAALFITADPLFILHNWPTTWHQDMYGHGSFFSYAERSLEFTGELLVIPLLIGLFARLRSRPWLPIISSFLLLFLLHSIFRTYGLFGEAGYPRYMVSVAPATAILTLEGWNRIVSVNIPRLFLNALGCVALALSILTSLLYVDAMSWARDPIAINEVATWLKQHFQPLPQVIWSNARMCSSLNLDFESSPPLRSRENLLDRLRNAPSGTIVFWDDHLGPDWFGVTGADIEQHGFETLKTSRYSLHAVLYPDDRLAQVSWVPFLYLLGPRELTLTVLQKR